MDPYNKEILNALRDGDPRNFHQILGEVAFSHNTLRLHLDSMVDNGLIIREKTPSKRRERPVYFYHASAMALASAPGALDEVVVLRSSELKRICRFHRGGRCRETRDRCEPNSCPNIRKKD